MARLGRLPSDDVAGGRVEQKAGDGALAAAKVGVGGVAKARRLAQFVLARVGVSSSALTPPSPNGPHLYVGGSVRYKEA